MKRCTLPALRLLACLFVISMSMAFAEEITQHKRSFYEEHTEAYVFTDARGQTMPYRLFVPRDIQPGERVPLLVSFHGAGSRGRDNRKHLRPWVAGWLAEEVQKDHPCIILMPQCPAGQRWVDTPWGRGDYSFSRIPVSGPMKLAKAIFDKVVRQEPVDPSRIYVMGASMGGYGTWDFVMQHPDLVAAAVPICGGGDPAMAQAIKDVPLWAFHGTRDNVVPPAGSEDMIEAIKNAGGTKAKLTLYPGVKHGSYERAWRERSLIDWLFKQKTKDSRPNVGGGE